MKNITIFAIWLLPLPVFSQLVLGGGGGGSVSGSAVVNLTYSTLMTMKGASLLAEGISYKITDYKTVYNVMEGKGVSTGDTANGIAEPIVVTANSSNSIKSDAYSTLYPQDVIYYDPDTLLWINDPAFVDENGYILGGWKGVIYYRYDTKQDVSCPYDFRNVKFRRYQENTGSYARGTTYSLGDFCKSGDTIYISLQNSNTDHTPNVTTNHLYWKPLIYVSTTRYIIYSSLGWSDDANPTFIIPANTNYQDVYTFSLIGTTYEEGIFNFHMERVLPTLLFGNSLLGNNVFYVDRPLGILNVRIGSNAMGNTFYANMVDIEIAENFFQNICVTNGGLFNRNHIGDDSYCNIYGENFGENFVATGNHSCYYGSRCMYNKIAGWSVIVGNEALGNDFGVYLNSIVLADSMYNVHFSGTRVFIGSWKFVIGSPILPLNTDKYAYRTPAGKIYIDYRNDAGTLVSTKVSD